METKIILAFLPYRAVRGGVPEREQALKFGSWLSIFLSEPQVPHLPTENNSPGPYPPPRAPAGEQVACSVDCKVTFGQHPHYPDSIDSISCNAFPLGTHHLLPDTVKPLVMDVCLSPSNRL